MPSGVDPESGPRGIDAAIAAYLRLSRLVVVAVSVAMFALMVAINGAEIVARGLFGVSFSWVQEVSILAAMWVYFFAYALIAKGEEYIRVDIIVNQFGPGAARAIRVAGRLATIAFHAVVVLFAIESFRFLGLFTTAILGWPESLFVLPILLGSADIVVTELALLYRQWSGRGARAVPVATE